jgi:phospholipid/cholesterol/gamma-HCH transport system ATP-binding protein
VVNPEVLLLDNPTHGLNENAVGLLIDEIRLRRESGELKHVFLVSDDERIQDQIVEQKVWINGLKLKLESNDKSKVMNTEEKSA